MFHFRFNYGTILYLEYFLIIIVIGYSIVRNCYPIYNLTKDFYEKFLVNLSKCFPDIVVIDVVVVVAVVFVVIFVAVDVDTVDVEVVVIVLKIAECYLLLHAVILKCFTYSLYYLWLLTSKLTANQIYN